MIKVGVIGVGHMGEFHVQKYKNMEDVELVGMCDLNSYREEYIASKYECKSLYLNEMIDTVDAVSITVPTKHHYIMSMLALHNGVNVLLEKPISKSIKEAEDMIKMAAKNNVIFQIGHVERFNPAVSKMMSIVDKPVYIGCKRIGPFEHRMGNEDIILDWMIHDIDIVNNILGKHDITFMKVNKISLITEYSDIAHVTAFYSNGSMVNFEVSRMANKIERFINIHDRWNNINVDLVNKKIIVGPVEYEIFKYDALEKEIRSFIDCIKYGTKPVVSGEDGKKALEIALKIMEG